MIKKQPVKVRVYSFLSSLFFCFTGVKGAKVLPPAFIDGGECSSIYMDPLVGSVALQNNVVGGHKTKRPPHLHLQTINRRQQHEGMIIGLLAFSVAVANHAALRGCQTPFLSQRQKKQPVNLQNITKVSLVFKKSKFTDSLKAETNGKFMFNSDAISTKNDVTNNSI